MRTFLRVYMGYIAKLLTVTGQITITKMHCLETRQKHSTTHYLCWVGLCKDMGPTRHVCKLCLPRISDV